MNFEQTIYDNTDVTAATGLSAATIQTWANRGVLMLTKQQQNPGPGQKRLYSLFDIARIAATQSLISYGLNASMAGRIAFRLERGLCAEQWKRAIQKNTQQIYIFLVDGDIGAICTDRSAVDDIRNLLSEDCPAGLGGPLDSGTQIQTKVAVFNIGPTLSNAVQFAAAWHKVEISKLDCPDVFARALITTFKKEFCDAGQPDDAQVFRGGDNNDNVIFYFSPAASAIARKDLRHHQSVSCMEPPDLAALKRIPL